MKLQTTSYLAKELGQLMKRVYLLFCTVLELGLNEAVAGQPGMTESTALGKELKLDLMMAFIGACEMWAIPDVLWGHGYIADREWEELWSGPIIEAERKLSWLVLRSYYEFCNRTKRAN
jgi:hypothetical protein